MAKRKVRRRRAPTSKSQSSKTLSMEQREKEAKSIKSALPRIYDSRGFDRLNSIPDYTEIMKENRLRSVVAHFFSKGPDYLAELSKDPNATLLEKFVVQLFMQAADKKDKEGFTKKRYLLDIFEPLKKEVHFSGDINQNINKGEVDFDKLSKEQLDEFDDFLTKLTKLPTKDE